MAAVVVVEQSTSAVEVLVESGGHVARGAQVELRVLARNFFRCLHHLGDGGAEHEVKELCCFLDVL
jgi:hypothetical protein